jgi:hypothetical protein
MGSGTVSAFLDGTSYDFDLDTENGYGIYPAEADERSINLDAWLPTKGGWHKLRLDFKVNSVTRTGTLLQAILHPWVDGAYET